MEEAAALGLTIKINTILVPGVNEGEVEAIARECAARGASFMNLIPLLPVQGTPLGGSGRAVEGVRRRGAGEAAADYLPQLSHCSRCRADAAGLLGRGHSLGEDFPPKKDPRRKPLALARPIMVAVASREGLLVNRHLGEAERLYRVSPRSLGRVRLRRGQADSRRGHGAKARWEDLAAI